MKITILGCGNAFSTENGNTNFLLEENGRNLLIDCGWDIPHMLKRNNVDVKNIDDIYISHLHADHIGGLEFIAFNRYNWQRKPLVADKSDNVPNLICNKDLMGSLWENSLKGGLSSIEGLENQATLASYFIPLPIDENQIFVWQQWECRLIQHVHVVSGTIITKSYGLFMSKKGHKSVYFVTDSQHCSPRQVEVFYKKADIIFQDCELLPFYTGVHANYEQLAGYEKANSVKLLLEIKNKMWLCHYQDFFNYDKDFFNKDCCWSKKAKDDGFAGFVTVGQQFEL